MKLGMLVNIVSKSNFYPLYAPWKRSSVKWANFQLKYVLRLTQPGVNFWLKPADITNLQQSYQI